MIAVGLLACVVAALPATGKGEGEAANLEWVKASPVPDSKPVAVPGGGGAMQLTDGTIRATGTNVSGYSLFRSPLDAADRRRLAGRQRPRSSARSKAPQGTEIAQSSGGLRGTYPRS